jgi:hypothetical protein
LRLECAQSAIYFKPLGTQMSFENGATTDFDATARVGGIVGSDFKFIPKELAIKCRKLVESYHDIHGYGSLPDMLWHSDARDIIECHRELAQIFKTASKSRCAKRANESLALIATVVASLEILNRDFLGWGKRFPAAKREADELLADFLSRSRTWFMDQYLYPSVVIQPDFARIIERPPGDLAVTGS